MLNFFLFVIISLIFFPPALRNLKQRHYKRAATFALLGLAALAGIHIWSDVYLTSLWYDNLGYESRYWKVLLFQAELFLAGGGVALSLGVANVFFWYHGAKPAGPSIVRNNRSKLILLAALFLQIPLFIASGTISSAHWNEALLFFQCCTFWEGGPCLSERHRVLHIQAPVFEFHRGFAQQPLHLFPFTCRGSLCGRECALSSAPRTYLRQLYTEPFYPPSRNADLGELCLRYLRLHRKDFHRQIRTPLFP